MIKDPFNVRQALIAGGKEYHYYSLEKISDVLKSPLDALPYTIRILIENLLRSYRNQPEIRQIIAELVSGKSSSGRAIDMPFFPGRVIMQDFTGVPALVDIAAMRSWYAQQGGNPAQINPLIPVDLVVDHSLQVDFHDLPDAMQRNIDLEFKRNRERYEFLRWGQKAFNNLRIVPPGSGIIHQINLEYLSPVVLTQKHNGVEIVFPDTVIGTDSHTTMINGLGVLGWGVGGIEATAAMLGEPIDLLAANVIGVKLSNQLPEGVTPTDLALTLTHTLRKKGVVNKFIEFFGDGLSSLSLADRAMIANMSPENGATVSFFPIDQQTLKYLKLTGRSDEQIELVEIYSRNQRLFREENAPVPAFSDVIELDLARDVIPSMAGPRRPQDRVSLGELKKSVINNLTLPASEKGFAIPFEKIRHKSSFSINGHFVEIGHGAVVIAAITSCTNTSNPFVMVGAGLLAKKALERGLKAAPYVKASLAPGSKVVAQYLEKAGLLGPLAEVGFQLVGFGCTTCIGNSGPLKKEVSEIIKRNDLIAAAVISGNRNFEGRIHPDARLTYLASPPLVVAFAIAGTLNIDITTEPLGYDLDGNPVLLKDIWPSNQEIQQVIHQNISSQLQSDSYANIFEGGAAWDELPAPSDALYPWQHDSTYIQEPPFFAKLSGQPVPLEDILGARTLAIFGDSVTTDHISPAGNIALNSAAGRYLQSLGVDAQDFNSYGSRRGNYQVMMRGTLANIRLKNLMLPGIEGSETLHLPEKTRMSIFDAAERYRSEKIPLIILAGKEYGTGSSRDWAAKGVLLLGVRAVVAESYERIHRSNLVGMGILPLQFNPGENAQSLGLTGHETYDIVGLQSTLLPQAQLQVRVQLENRNQIDFQMTARLDTLSEIEHYRQGGILNAALKKYHRSLLEEIS